MKYPLYEGQAGDPNGSMIPSKVSFQQGFLFNNQQITFEKIEDKTIMTHYQSHKQKHKKQFKQMSPGSNSDENKKWKNYIKVDKSIDPVKEFRL